MGIKNIMKQVSTVNRSEVINKQDKSETDRQTKENEENQKTD